MLFSFRQIIPAHRLFSPAFTAQGSPRCPLSSPPLLLLLASRNSHPSPPLTLIAPSVAPPSHTPSTRLLCLTLPDGLIQSPSTNTYAPNATSSPPWTTLAGRDRTCLFFLVVPSSL
ncbi:hypothetical protein BJY00DRAFT_216418 [Aspergillus carlsbadensis]|nr:hypothetical protein BJY00DRAFT_216418 [Aspergillus carlsbadensis]